MFHTYRLVSLRHGGGGLFIGSEPFESYRNCELTIAHLSSNASHDAAISGEGKGEASTAHREVLSGGAILNYCSSQVMAVDLLLEDLLAENNIYASNQPIEAVTLQLSFLSNSLAILNLKKYYFSLLLAPSNDHHGDPKISTIPQQTAANWKTQYRKLVNTFQVLFTFFV
jgi:hypothetical protein